MTAWAMIRTVIAGALIALAYPIEATAQSCNGQYAAGQVCGNSGSSLGLPSAQSLSPLLDRNFGSSQGSILNRGSSLWSATQSPVLGIPGSATGALGFAGSSGGTVTVQPTNSTGSWTFKLPPNAGSANYVLITDGSGNSSWASNAAGGTVTSVGLSLPGIFSVAGSPITSSGTLTATLATQSANLVWAGPGSGAASAPTFRSLVGADLPNPAASTLGGIESYAAVTHQWINTISTAGVPASSQPAFTDISGMLSAAQCPNPGASSLGCIESLAAVTSKWINTISTSGVPSATQPSFGDISGNATLSQLPTIGNNTVLGNNSGGTSVPATLSATQVLDFIGSTQGNVLYRNGSVWTVLAPGTNGQVLTTAGASANPTWTTVTGTGTVTSIATNNGVTGGTITTTGTIGLANISAGTILANATGGSTTPTGTTPTLVLDIIGSTEGSVLYRGASAWLALSPGTNGQVLQTQGAGATPQWANAGSVSSITCNGGLTGGTITTSGTCAVDIATATNFKAGTANKILDAAGVFTTETTTTYGATTTFDMSTFFNTKVTLTGNITTVTVNNIKAGQSGTIRFIQDGTGSRTLPATFNANFVFAGGTQPVLTTTASAIDALVYSCSATNYCVASLINNVK